MSQHILLPEVFGGDGDKAVCGVRISTKLPEGHSPRTVAAHPRDLSDNGGCERCYLRTLRSWQKLQPGFDTNPANWPHWPWEAPPAPAPAPGPAPEGDTSTPDP